MYTIQHQQLLSKYKQNSINTIGELRYEEVLKYLNLHYLKQKGFLSKAYVCLIVDFYLPRPYKTIIEIDGGYHQTRREKDHGRDMFFERERGMRTIRIDNDHVLNTPIHELAAELSILLRKNVT